LPNVPLPKVKNVVVYVIIQSSEFLSWIDITHSRCSFTELDKQLLMFFITFIIYSYIVLSYKLSQTSSNIHYCPRHCLRHQFSEEHNFRTYWWRNQFRTTNIEVPSTKILHNYNKNFIEDKEKCSIKIRI
jgi:hypothetical protein